MVLLVFVNAHFLPTQSTTAERSRGSWNSNLPRSIAWGKDKTRFWGLLLSIYGSIFVLLQLYSSFALHNSISPDEIIRLSPFFSFIWLKFFHQHINVVYFAENRCVYSFLSASTVVDSVFKSRSSNLPWWMGWGSNLCCWDVFFLNYYSANIWLFAPLQGWKHYYKAKWVCG